MGVAATVAPKVLGPQDSTKKLGHCKDLFVQTLFQKPVLKISGLIKQWDTVFKIKVAVKYDTGHFIRISFKILLKSIFERSCKTFIASAL